MLYLDNSATTPIAPEVKDAMLPYLMEEFGNPSSKYYTLAKNAKQAVEKSRQQIGKLLGCDTDEIIFTSGATESNNMILKGVAERYVNTKKNHIITSKVEHPSVLEVCQYLETKGFKVTYLDVDQFARIDLNQLESSIDSTVFLVSLMWGNNELGSLNDMSKIQEICLKHDIFLHTDATQVIGKVDFDLIDYEGINFFSCSAHKFYGPKGVGIAMLKKDSLGLSIPITPLLHGGKQENGLRSGTLSVHNIVGMGKAAELANINLKKNIQKLIELEDALYKILEKQFEDNIIFNSDRKNKIPGIINLRFPNFNNEILAKKLAPYVATSTGSACSSAYPSYVLQESGLSLEEVRTCLRFSLNHFITLEELEIFNSL